MFVKFKEQSIVRRSSQMSCSNNEARCNYSGWFGVTQLEQLVGPFLTMQNAVENRMSCCKV